MSRSLKKPAAPDDGPAQEGLMAISSITSSSSTTDIQGVTPSAISPTNALASADAANGVNVDISKPGQLFSQLSSLAQNDPDQFKAVSADIAQKLKDAAGSASGGQADFLNKIADRFQSASQSGNVSDLAPPNAGKARHHGGHHGGGHHGGSTGGGGGGSAGQTIEGIISSALSAASSSSSSSSSVPAAGTASGGTTNTGTGSTG
jgi:hypothetical protein